MSLLWGEEATWELQIETNIASDSIKSKMYVNFDFFPIFLHKFWINIIQNINTNIGIMQKVEQW